MGLFGFFMGLGKSREAKMAIWILGRAPKHIAKMMTGSNEYWEACKRFPGRKAEIDDIAGAAFITNFFLYLLAEVGKEKWKEIYMNFALHTSSNLRNLVGDCIKSVLPSDVEVNDTNDRFGCAKWLYDTMQIKGFIPMDFRGVVEREMGQHEFTNVFTDECLTIGVDIISFKKKFLRL